MSITVEKYPANVEFADNPVVFQLKTTNMYSYAGTYAVLSLKISGIDTIPGHSFKLSWSTYELIFTLALNPDDSGLQIRSASGGEDKCDWGSDFYNSLNSNYLLNRDFNIEGGCSGDYIITITAKEKGSAFSLTFSDSNVVNLSQDSVTVGNDPVMRSGYKLLSKLYVDDGVSIICLGEDRITPDDQGICNFDFSELLKSHIFESSSFEFPEGLTNFLFDRNSQIIKYFIEYAEYYSSSVRELISTVDNPNYILDGGIDFIKLAKYHEDDSSFWDKMQYNKDFLTWQPINKKIWIRQPEKLYYLVWNALTTTIKLMIKIYYNDDTDYTHEQDTQTVSQYDLYECILSYNKLDLISLPQSAGKEIKKYEVWIADQDDAKISISRYFELDRRIYTNQRFFIFRNSLSGFDTIRFTGETAKSTDLKRSSITILNDFDFTSLDAQIKNNTIFESQKYKVSSGWLTKEQTEYLREFELSTEVYEFILNRLYPVVLVNSKSAIHKDNEYLYNRTIEYARAYKDSNYSYDDNILDSKNFNKSFNSSYLTGE